MSETDLITRKDIDALNARFKTIRVTASVSKLRKLQKLCRSRSPRDIYKYKITPLVVARLRPRTAASFNHPKKPLGFKRGLEHTNILDPNVSAPDLAREISTLKQFICGGDPWRTFGCDFRYASAGAAQRNAADYHLDSCASKEGDPLEKRLHGFVNGNDRRMRTIVIRDITARPAQILRRLRSAFVKKVDPIITEAFQRVGLTVPIDTSSFNPAYKAKIKGLAREYMIPPNSVTFALRKHTVHRSAVNKKNKRVQRSFMYVFR
ncbi:MAG: hypothetical protein AB7G06_07935 [Bdellovibrionales bacterium]